MMIFLKYRFFNSKFLDILKKRIEQIYCVCVRGEIPRNIFMYNVGYFKKEKMKNNEN